MTPTVRAEGGSLVIADRAGNRLVWTCEDAMAIATGIQQLEQERTLRVIEEGLAYRARQEYNIAPTARAGGTREGTR